MEPAPEAEPDCPTEAPMPAAVVPNGDATAMPVPIEVFCAAASEPETSG